MESLFDPAQFLTTLLISIAHKHPTIHGLLVLNSLIVAVLPRAAFEHEKFGFIARFMGLLSMLAPRSAIGTVKLPFVPVRWPPLALPAPTPPPLRVDRPDVVKPPTAAEPHPSADADSPTPVDGVPRGSMVPPAPGADDPNA